MEAEERNKEQCKKKSHSVECTGTDSGSLKDVSELMRKRKKSTRHSESSTEFDCEKLPPEVSYYGYLLDMNLTNDC